MLNFSYLKNYKKNILITAGDYDGIGSEVIAKSLNSIKLKNDISITVFLSKQDTFFKKCFKPQTHIYIFYLNKKPHSMVSFGANLCKIKKFNAFVNGPMSKGKFKMNQSAGHTEILQSLTKKKITPVFLGSKFNVILATSHLPLKKVSSVFGRSNLTKLNQLAHEINQATFKEFDPTVFLGINPHAGEGGLLGNEELILKNKINPFNFTSSDGFFSQKLNYYRKTIVAAYHDQGLIPFKMAHQDGKAVQISAGLPFLRVTVCHGTAKDIYGKNIAKFDSMLEAIKLAINHKL